MMRTITCDMDINFKLGCASCVDTGAPEIDDGWPAPYCTDAAKWERGSPGEALCLCAMRGCPGATSGL